MSRRAIGAASSSSMSSCVPTPLPTRSSLVWPRSGRSTTWTSCSSSSRTQNSPMAATSRRMTWRYVAFTIKGFIAKEPGSPRQTKYLSIEGAQDYADGKANDVSGIKVVDPKTLVVTLAKPDAPFLYNMRSIFVVPKAALEGKSLTDDPFFQNPIGAGPYVFQSWSTGADFVATKNPHYWQEGKPAIAS